MKFKKIISIILVVTLVLSNFVFASTVSPKSSIDKAALQQALKQQLVEKLKQIDDNKRSFKHEDYDGLVNPEANSDRLSLYEGDTVRVVVELEGDSLAKYAVNNGKTLETVTEADKEVVFSNLDKVQSSVINSIAASKLDVKVKYEFKTVLNGFSAEVNKADLEKLKKLPNVKKVTVSNVYNRDMATAIDYTNAAEVWNNPELGYKGEGMVIAIIDTGIDWRHKDLQTIDETKIAWTEEEVTAAIGDGSGKYFTNKVPFGWNWADNNDEVIDLGAGASMHGQHVAGIAGANGELKGVAPEAQLLAEKVFSNNQETGAFSDDLVAAIEHAVAFNADVLNMSLGSTAGFVLPNDPEQAAIKNAVDNGVICVVSAGNSAYMSVGYDYPLAINPDTAVVGSPGLFTDTVQSAAANNTKVLFEHNIAIEGLNPIVGYGVDSWESLTNPLEIVAVGGSKLGYPEDYAGMDVEGKIVLVKRGTLTFLDKTMNAAAAGAAGIIVYDHGLSTFYKDQGGWAIPFMNITKSAGEALAALLGNETKSINVTLKTEKVDPTSGLPASFSSWGPTPNLEFKPDFMAPGGSINSLANDDQYQVMSGTSMSAPHMAGGMALIAQALKERVENEELTFANDRSFVEYAKIIGMNTAEPTLNKYGYEYQPRLQGAGMMKLDRAIKTPVFITDENGNAGVSLKEIGNTSEFTLTLTNVSNTAVEYDVNATVATDYIFSDGFISQISVYMTEDDYDADHIATISPDKSTVTVPANSTATVKVTLNVEKATRNSFIEGYVYFTPKNEEIPQLSVPYFGFYGDWNEPNIIDPVGSDPNSYFGYTGLLGEAGGDGELYYVDYISPANEDGDFDYTMPIISLLRNAKDFVVEIKDSKGNVIRTVTSEQNLRKVHDLDEGKNPYKFSAGWSWDGKAYDKTNNTFDYVADGNYTVQLKTRIHYDNAKWQTLELPIAIDNTAPEVTLGELPVSSEDGTLKLEWTAEEEGSGIIGMFAIVYEVDENGDLTGRKEITEIANVDAKSQVITLPYKLNAISFAALDGAMNFTMVDAEDVVGNDAYAHVGAPVVVIDSPSNLSIFSDYNVTVNGHIVSDVVYDGVLFVNGEEVTVDENNEFTADVTYTQDGWNDLQVEAYYEDLYDAEDPATFNNRTAYSYKLIIDTTTPEVSVNLDETVQGFIVNGTKYLTVNGVVTDETTIGNKFMVNDEIIMNNELDDFTALNQEFTYTGPLATNVPSMVDPEDIMLFSVTDIANNGSELTVTCSVYEDGYRVSDGENYVDIAFTDVSDSYEGPEITAITPAEESVVNADNVDVAVTASSIVGIKEVYINNKEASLEDGKYVLNIPVVDGENPVAVRVVDKIGMVKESEVTVNTDINAPVIEIAMPFKTTALATIDIIGSVSDFSDITSVTVAGEEVELDENNEFAVTVDLAVGKNVIEVTAADEFGHESVHPVAVTRVEGAPTLTTKLSNNGYIRYTNPVLISGTSDRPVKWEITILDQNDEVVTTVAQDAYDYAFAYSWTPDEDAATGNYTVEYLITDEAGLTTTNTADISVYNLPVEVVGIQTKTVKGVNANTFKIGDVVQLSTTIKAIEDDVNGLVIVKVEGPNKKPFAYRFAPDTTITQAGNTVSLGFSLDGIVQKGNYTVKVYVWNDWDDIQALSTVGTYTFVVE